MKIEENLDENEKDIVKFISKKVGRIRTIKYFTKLYNSFCNECKGKAIANPKRSMNDYCSVCQDKIKELYDKIDGKVKK